jgi:hypothetical protein
VAIGTNHYLSGEDQTLLGEKDMFDTCFSDFKVMGEMLSLRELPENLTLFRRRNILGRGEVIGDQDDPILIENFFHPDLFEGLDGKRSGDIVSEGEIDPYIQELAGGDMFFPGMGCQDLLCDGHRRLRFHILPNKPIKVEAKVKVE